MEWRSGPYLLVGLGNPGSSYENNRHNIGFMALDRIAQSCVASGNWRSRFKGDFAEGRVGSDKLYLLKPHTYMNNSGEAVREAAQFYKLSPEQIIVFHDDLDLDPARIKVKQGGGHGGHNGLRSIDAHLTPNYWRVRLGIGHPGDKNLVHNWVLGNFIKDDADWRDPLLDAIARQLPTLIAGDRARFCEKIRSDSTQPSAPKPEAPTQPPAPKATPRKAASPFDKLKSLLGDKN